MLGDVTGGWLSDRLGRKPVSIVPLALLALLVLPAFWAMDHYRVLPVLYGAVALMTLLFCIGAAPSFTMITEQLPMHVRAGPGQKRARRRRRLPIHGRRHIMQNPQRKTPA